MFENTSLYTVYADDSAFFVFIKKKKKKKKTTKSPKNVTGVVCTIFDMHQTSSTHTGMWACD